MLFSTYAELPDLQTQLLESLQNDKLGSASELTQSGNGVAHISCG